MNDQIAKPTALAPRQQQYSLAPTNFEEALRFAELLAKSDLAPKDYKGKPGNCMIAMQMGAEVGLSPMQAIQNIAVINGRPSVWGDAMLALCQSHPDFEDCQESDDGATATCVVLRRGRAPVTRTFSMAEAQQAGLLNKDGPWKTYPKRMRQMRARGFALRDAFADRLRGLHSAEESSDLPIDATPRRRGEPRLAPEQQKPVDKSNVIDTTGTEPDAADYAITFGKNKGKALRELQNNQLHWYAEEYDGRDVELKRKARAVIDARKAAAEAENKKQVEAAGENPDWGLSGDEPTAVFQHAIRWAGRDRWIEKPLAEADHDTLLQYGSAIATALEQTTDETVAEDISAHLREVEAAIAAKQPKPAADAP